MDSQKRIKELEDQVAGLQEDIARLKPKGARTSTDSDTGLVPPSRAWLLWDVWLSRVALVFTAGVVVVATFVGYREEALTVAQALNLGRDVAAVPSNYRLMVCAVFAALSVLAYVLRWRGLFIALGMAAVYLTHVLCFSTLMLGRFWFPLFFLTSSYVLFSGACVLEGRKPGKSRRRRLALLAGVNSIVYFALAWASVSEYAPERAWLFRIWFTLVLVGFTVLAETSGHRRNYLFQLFAVKTVLMFVFTLEAFLPGQLFWIATAAACVALGLAHVLTGIVALKATNLFLLLITFTGVLRAVRMADSDIGTASPVPESWLVAGVTIGACFLLAWLYEHWVLPARSKRARVSGHWFLAGTRLDVPGATASMLHAAAGALILLTLTILESAGYENQALVLAVEGTVLVVAGLVLLTPQIELAGLLLLAGAHVVVASGLLGSETPLEVTSRLTWLAALIAAVTYWAAYRWEMYLARIKGGSPWEHYLTASAPYVMSTALLAALLARLLPGVFGIALQSILGIGLLFTGWRLKRPTIKLAGLGGLSVGAATYVHRIVGIEAVSEDWQLALAYLGVLLITCIGGERLIRWLERRNGAPTAGDEPSRSVLVMGGTVLTMFVLFSWVSGSAVTLAWALVPAAAIVLAGATGEKRYAWAAFFALGCMATRAFWRDLSGLSAGFWYPTLAVTACLFGLAFWRLKGALPSPTPFAGEAVPPDEDQRHV